MNFSRWTSRPSLRMLRQASWVKPSERAVAMRFGPGSSLIVFGWVASRLALHSW